MGVFLQKQIQRNHIIKQRLLLGDSEYQKKCESLTQHLFEFLLNQNFQSIHTYLSIAKNREVDTSKIVEWLFQNKKKVYVPVVEKSQLITVKILPGTVYKTSKWGIKEPADVLQIDVCPEIVLTPVLAVDGSGNRLGYGKGFYDRYFTGLMKNSCEPFKIGLAFDFQVVNSVPKAISPKHQDIPLDYVVTDQGVIFCRRGA